VTLRHTPLTLLLVHRAMLTVERRQKAIPHVQPMHRACLATRQEKSK
jgi:hypothetical protein